MSDSLGPHELQHTRLFCPPLSPRVCSNSCPLSWWCNLNISSSAITLSFCLQSFPASGPFPWVGSLYQVAKVLELQLHNSPFNEYSGLISFRIDWFDLLAVQGTLKSPLQTTISSLALSLLYGSTLTSIHDYWKNHSFGYMDLCQQNDISAF